MEGSDAQGCMVLLLSTYNNVTANITRSHHSSKSANATVDVEVPTSCYNEVYAFDIEYDGGIGTLAIPGHLINTMGESNMVPQCDLNSFGN